MFVPIKRSRRRHYLLYTDISAFAGLSGLSCFLSSPRNRTKFHPLNSASTTDRRFSLTMSPDIITLDVVQPGEPIQESLRASGKQAVSLTLERVQARVSQSQFDRFF
jgi:hypothetical protein